MGSSPLTRGKREAAPKRPNHLGLIPAHAGKTPTPTPRSRPRQAHPRSRGENHVLIDQDTGRPKLIPAHAGKTGRSGLSLWGHAAHPRSRGENTRSRPTAHVASGSSPLTRGKLDERLHRRAPKGLIPAHAGKTNPALSPLMRGWAHPRSRGENSHARPRPDWTLGSSPLTRGKRERSRRGSARGRLIPAHAGKTIVGDADKILLAAHPRSRGENLWNLTHGRFGWGSSPLTRGKHHVDCPAHHELRLIPAHAGKTVS